MGGVLEFLMVPVGVHQPRGRVAVDAEEQVTELLALYGRCLKAVEGKEA